MALNIGPSDSQWSALIAVEAADNVRRLRLMRARVMHQFRDWWTRTPKRPGRYRSATLVLSIGKAEATVQYFYLGLEMQADNWQRRKQIVRLRNLINSCIFTLSSL